MRGFDRNRLLAISATGVLAAGALGGASLVAAQSGGDGADENNANEEGQRPHKRAKGGALATIFDVSGLDASVFRDGFAEGLTVNEILAQNGLDSAVIQASALARPERQARREGRRGRHRRGSRRCDRREG